MGTDHPEIGDDRRPVNAAEARTRLDIGDQQGDQGLAHTDLVRGELPQGAALLGADEAVIVAERREVRDEPRGLTGTGERC